MATDRNDDFTLTHYLNLTAQRGTLLDQVPFFLGLKDNPPVIRRILEAILASVCWTVTDVAGAYPVVNDDVILLADTSGGACTITLQAIGGACGSGRVHVIKDAGGVASVDAITINTDAADTIDGLNTSFVLSADYGAVILVAGNGNEWHTIALV